ncbi:sulfotransferase domain-containing protein [Pseudohalocynthiibacter aestuariivivens]|uniref:Sulfotransferase domain-containing protein n=1 Tax=Roseovarius pelagicus TaxID=2980108 RepID=A0ABY6DDM5_9RHOB|nr:MULTISPECIES: sulfotransferase domain-containing protein [Rhodobacterales]QIE47185.1 sulfotransferase domain-containing protein [Pseudohalocynthiibacter aestuariivivens]UXX84262.1 sulfotransferase domain-containing protein [Roseovarius pelagicus]
MKNSIVWLASYPKSGNTWTRIFLANYLANTQEPMPINQVNKFGMGDAIAKTYHMVAGRRIDTRDLALTLSLREKVLRGIVANNADVNLVKTHNIKSVARGIDLIPTKYTRSAIYIMRDPRDMVLSAARHYGEPVEKVVARIARSDNATQADDNTVAVFQGSWSEHVKSWTGYAPYPVLTLRYEDMLTNPHQEFAKTLTHLGVPVDDERLDRAVRHASFDEVSKQETETGFMEKPAGAEKFFASGRSGQWKTDLDPALADQICNNHAKTMKKFGYLE